jgi:hypothetical protein
MTPRIALVTAAVLSVTAPAMAQNVDMSSFHPRLTFPEPAPQPAPETVTRDRQAQ